MNEKMHIAASPALPSSLTCWKDIARYFGKGVRTVQRWERELGLPVRRPSSMQHASKSPVAADPRDLEKWLQSRWALRNEPEAESAPQAPRTNVPLALKIEKSRNLRAELRTALQQQQDLMRQLSMAVTALKQSCNAASPRWKTTASLPSDCSPAAISPRISMQTTLALWGLWATIP